MSEVKTSERKIVKVSMDYKWHRRSIIRKEINKVYEIVSGTCVNCMNNFTIEENFGFISGDFKEPEIKTDYYQMNWAYEGSYGTYGSVCICKKCWDLYDNGFLKSDIILQFANDVIMAPDAWKLFELNNPNKILNTKF